MNLNINGTKSPHGGWIPMFSSHVLDMFGWLDPWIHPSAYYSYGHLLDAPWCWNIYLHLPKNAPNAGKYTIHGAYGNGKIHSINGVVLTTGTGGRNFSRIQPQPRDPSLPSRDHHRRQRKAEATRKESNHAEDHLSIYNVGPPSHKMVKKKKHH